MHITNELEWLVIKDTGFGSSRPVTIHFGYTEGSVRGAVPGQKHRVLGKNIQIVGSLDLTHHPTKPTNPVFAKFAHEKFSDNFTIRSSLEGFASSHQFLTELVCVYQSTVMSEADFSVWSGNPQWLDVTGFISPCG